MIFKFQGIDSITDAGKLAGADVAIPWEDRLELPNDEYYQTDLIGCAVEARDGKAIGVVEGWREYGGPPLLAVNANGREILVPFAKSICVEIDAARRRIVVELPEGLEDL